jgi:putative transcriptional regulator
MAAMSFSPFLVEQLLIAMPAMGDPNFARSVTFVCQHDDSGAMGLVINRASDFTLGELLGQLQIPCDDAELLARPVLAGGPVQADRGFVLHDGEHQFQSSLRLPGGLSVTTSRDVLAAMAAGNGPSHALVTLGYAGWTAGQLETELAENAWLTAPASNAILFEAPMESRWQAAARGVGVDLSRLADYAGHA